MKVMHIGPEGRTPTGGDLFIGQVSRQSLVGEDDAKDLRVGVVTFHDGAVNKYHHHTFDQVLVVVEGEGIVQLEGGPEQRIAVGDVVFVPAGERHWHGAAEGKTMSHLTVSTPGTTQMT